MLTVSVIIPAKNEEKYLPHVLEALRKQTVQPLEVVVADAQSTDKTREIARSFSVKVVEGGLPGPGRNLGAKGATSDVLLFLDADVTINDDRFLEKALKEFEERSFDLATADVYLTNGSGSEQWATRFYSWYVRLWGDKHPHPPGFCFFIKRELFEQVGGFDETVVFCEDHDLGLRAGKKGKFGVLDSIRIGIDDRRLRKEGSLKAGLKYVLAEFFIFAFGPIRTNIFNYGFKYEKRKSK